MKKSDIPNILSVIRLAMVPLFVALYVQGHIVYAVAVFILAGITDVVDGYVARKYNFISDLGKILDPLADKAIQLSAFVCLYLTERIPLWMPLIYFAKELATAVGAMLVFRKKHLVVKSNVFGKGATVLVFASVCAIAMLELPKNVVTIICIAISCYFVFSCCMYAVQYFKNILKPQSSEDSGTQKA